MNKFFKIHKGKEKEENLMRGKKREQRDRDQYTNYIYMYKNISYFFTGGYS